MISKLKKLLPLRITDQISLRFLELSDAPSFVEMVKFDDQMHRQNSPWVDNRQTIEATEKYIRSIHQKHEENLALYFAITFNNQFVGEIKVHEIFWDSKKAEVGYWLFSKFHGNGLVTQSLRKTAEILFSELGIYKIFMTMSENNIKSLAVAERAGFKKENYLPNDRIEDGKPCGTYYFELLSTNFKT